MSHQSPDYFKDVNTTPRPIDAAVAPLAYFMKKEAAGGIVLMVGAVAALVLANFPLGGVGLAFHEFWTGTPITLNVGSWVFPSGKHPAHLEWWVNDALMAAFFFVIGLEIKREFLAGELRDPRKAALPLVAAVGGMAVPGLIYAAFNWGGEAMRGWAIPTATDIAFALGVLALLGRRIPPGLRVFLVTLAIADDLGALLIIAIFYTSSEHLSMASLGLAAAAMGVMGGMNLLGVRRWWVFGLVGLALWYFVLQSGVHPTIAGVMGAMMIPVRTRIDGAEFTKAARRLADEFDRDAAVANGGAGGDGNEKKTMLVTSPVQQGVLRTMEQLTEGAQTPLQRLEKGMVPLAAFFVVPVFALANAGVSVGDVAGRAVRDSEAWGIVLGLVVGKTVGILGASFLAVRLGLSVLPTGVTWRHMLGAALLGGIGFTMSLFIAHLAFGSSERLEIAKLAVLTGSTLAAVLGAGVLLTCRPTVAATPPTASEH
ncbi:Na(+)/H(+) antiporter NhaA [Phycisphaerales bacterium]|nr:Na(+)/H(+) antiporter NhaA [Phycisphaerales bacterium]